MLGLSLALPVTIVLRFTQESTRSVGCLLTVALIVPPAAVLISSDLAACLTRESLDELYRAKALPLSLPRILTVEDLRLQSIIAYSKSFAIKK